MSGYTVVYCDLSDCFYYSPEPGFPRKCRCLHPDKPTVINMVKCPLYRLDWQKRAPSLNPPKEANTAHKFEVEGRIKAAEPPKPTKKQHYKKYETEED